jgi:hypothetical protein
MSLSCRFGLHHPLPASILARRHGPTALCNANTTPLERSPEGWWKACAPFTAGVERRA